MTKVDLEKILGPEPEIGISEDINALVGHYRQRIRWQNNAIDHMLEELTKVDQLIIQMKHVRY